MIEKMTFEDYKQYLMDGDEDDFKRYLQENTPPPLDPLYLPEEVFDDYYGKFVVAERDGISHAHIDELMEDIVAVVKKYEEPVTYLQLNEEVKNFDGDSKSIGNIALKIVLWEDISFLAVAALNNLCEQGVLSKEMNFGAYVKQGYVLNRPLINADIITGTKVIDGPCWLPIVFKRGPKFDSFEVPEWYPEKYNPLCMIASDVQVINRVEDAEDDKDDVSEKTSNHDSNAPDDIAINADLAESVWGKELDLEKINRELSNWIMEPGPGIKQVPPHYKNHVNHLSWLFLKD